MIKRAFVYGDLLFETMRVKNGDICFADRHFNRLIQSAKILHFETNSLTFDVFKQQIFEKLVNKEDARVRFVLYRKGDGFYVPTSNNVKWNIEIFSPFIGEKICDRLDVFSDCKKFCQQLSNLKSGNALISVMAGLYAKQNHFDDCLILNEYDRITEAISSNVFVVKDENLYTPPLSEGCVDGVMRNIVIEKAKENGIYIIEKPISQDEIQNADEVFLTNAINGIVSVKSFQSKLYSTNFTLRLKSIINF